MNDNPYEIYATIAGNITRRGKTSHADTHTLQKKKEKNRNAICLEYDCAKQFFYFARIAQKFVELDCGEEVKNV